MKQIKAGLFQTVGLIVVGGAAGIVAGLLELLTGTSIEQNASTGAAVFPFLMVLMPIWLLLLNLYPEDPSLYASLGGSLITLLLAGLAGGILGCAAFLVPATNLPVIFAGKNPTDLSLALQGAIGRGTFALVVGITTGAALLIGVWTHVRMSKPAASESKSGK